MTCKQLVTSQRWECRNLLTRKDCRT